MVVVVVVIVVVVDIIVDVIPISLGSELRAIVALSTDASSSKTFKSIIVILTHNTSIETRSIRQTFIL